ncbi:YcaO-like family protein [Halapricum desulfuricans]|uniref:Ribosomal protein S12 methylthiotransferase accessory factor YcaO n=1 Tax=Halapricum desulfuricans TaxID=2841257 RepID=A0A897N8D2_9EURY|nr:YcaO-like family protein [Halapricum desulfuricans]QSG08701.1 Ribosomal protein S12 methylthiotransferase accessory factor YcaO [Halapricum desulfuricans]
MTVGLVGSGPAAEAVTAAVADVNVSVTQTDPSAFGSQQLGVVVAVAGDRAFERANSHALETDTPWIAVELGGIGGYPVVDAAVAGFDPESGCYECLQGRVGATVDPDAQPTAAPAVPVQRFAGAIAGRAASTAATGGDSPLFGQAQTIPQATHPLLELPGCVCGSAPSPAIERDTSDGDFEVSLELAEQALDERTGIVTEVGEAESYPAPYYLAQVCDTNGFSDVTASQEAAGVSDDWNEALMKALGEGLERYCAGVYRTDDFREATAADLDGAVTPSLFVSPGRPDDSARREWVPGEHLQSGDDAWLPAELVYYPPHEQDIRPAITTGLGLERSTVGALLAGLYEIVERDAAMLSWYSTFEPLELDVSDDRFHELAGRARSENLSVTPLLLTQDIDIPVVAVAVHRNAEWPRFALGSAADLDAEAGARSALAEAVQNWLELDGMGREQAAEASGAIGWYADFPEEIEAFMGADRSVPAASVGPDEVPSDEDELDLVLDRLADADLDAYATRITTRDVASVGFEAVRVLAPGAQPLFFDDAYFGERARTVPESLGFESRLDREHHPFP